MWNFSKTKFNVPHEFPSLLESIFECAESERSEYQEIKKEETAKNIARYILPKLERCQSSVSAEEIDEWMEDIKKELSIKGRPLFKGFRCVLTLTDEGPDLKILIPLTPLPILRKRVQTFLGEF